MPTQANPPILCFSHLRWGFVFQRPQHILSRLAADRAVYYFEEPEFEDDATPELIEERPLENLSVLRARLPRMSEEDAERAQAALLKAFMAERGIVNPVLWHYTPMALGLSQRIPRSACVYDCMDELSMFAFAPPKLREREQALFAQANVVFTGGRSLFYNKRRHHANVHCHPSAVDAAHFAPAGRPDPADQRAIARPRFGFYGVIDERFDAQLVDAVAQAKPEWQFVFLGPVVKIDPESLPKRDNIHYLGQRSYAELPAYLEHWDVAVLPFALNDATRFISPTKTLEYLAARKPVISTPIADVVDPYGEKNLVAIASSPEEFVAAGETILRAGVADRWYRDVERTVQELSWDATVRSMASEIDRILLADVVAR